MRRPWTPTYRSLAALLLVMQGPGTAVLASLHARDPAGAPTVIESEHSSLCPVVHDAVTCPQCQHGGLLAVGPLARAPGRGRALRLHAPWALDPVPAAPATRRTPPPRGPPALPA